MEILEKTGPGRIWWATEKGRIQEKLGPGEFGGPLKKEEFKKNWAEADTEANEIKKSAENLGPSKTIMVGAGSRKVQDDL